MSRFQGNIASISLFATTALQCSLAQDSMPAVMAARQWKYTLEKGKVNVQPAILASTLFAFCAWSAKTQAKFTNRIICGGSSSDFGHDSIHCDLHFPINKRLMEIAGQPLDGQKSA